ncbi:hypothetical protein Aduo_019248 [Ancylostoma duodenale]
MLLPVLEKPSLSEFDIIGKNLLASCSEDMTVRIWNIARNDLPPEPPTSKKKGHKKKTGKQPTNGKDKKNGAT